MGVGEGGEEGAAAQIDAPPRGHGRRAPDGDDALTLHSDGLGGGRGAFQGVDAGIRQN